MFVVNNVTSLLIDTSGLPKYLIIRRENEDGYYKVNDDISLDAIFSKNKIKSTLEPNNEIIVSLENLSRLRLVKDVGFWSDASYFKYIYHTPLGIEFISVCDENVSH